MNTAMTTNPTTAPLRRNSRRKARRAGLSSSSSAAIWIAPSVASVMRLRPQPRVDEHIGDIGDQVQHDVDGRRHQDDALHDGVIAIEHGIDDQLAETRN